MKRALLAMTLILAACAGSPPEGLAPAVTEPSAPVVVFDLAARPLPEIPLPNDLATRLDPNEPFTGRRVNVSLDAPTAVEREVRRRLSLTNGFGIYAPITVSFTRPLNLDELEERHQHDLDFDDDAVYIVDGGNTTIWGMFFHETRVPNTMLSTPKFGMLGAGVPQALGAAVARPGKQVYSIIGDGAMGFNVQELETAVRNKLNVIFLVCCDKQWGMVKMTQQFVFRPWKTLIKKSLDPGETINADLEEIRFDKLAESMGAHGERVSEPEQLRPALERCAASGKPAVIHVDVDPVKHMWAPNLMTFKKMHQEPAGK